MAGPTLADRLRAGDTIVSAWVTMPEPIVAELAARAGFDCVMFDMQHGLQDAGSVMRGIGSAAFGGKPAAVRLDLNAMGMASRALDLGAEAVVAPMINTVADARALVAATKYPPVGERSWGPTRALTVLGFSSPAQYLAAANSATLAFAMIETAQALDAIDDILAVEGLDGIFMGPSDLSVTLSAGARITPTEAWLDEPIRKIADRARAKGKFAGAFAVNGERARFFRDVGYRLIALGSDQIYLATGIAAMLQAARAP